MSDETKFLARDLARAALGNGPVGWVCAVLSLACPGLTFMVLLTGWNPALVFLGCAAPFPLALLAGVAAACRKKGDMAARLSEHDSPTTWMTVCIMSMAGVILPVMVFWLLFSPLTLAAFAACAGLAANSRSRAVLGRIAKTARACLDWRIPEKTRFALLYPGALVPWTGMVVAMTLYESRKGNVAGTDNLAASLLAMATIFLGGPVLVAFQAACSRWSRGKRLSDLEPGTIAGMFLLGVFLIPGPFIALCRQTGLHPLVLGAAVPVLWYGWCRILAGPATKARVNAAREKTARLWSALWDRPMACPARRVDK